MVGVITTAWTSILTWMVTSINSIQAIFYDATANNNEGALTFLGTLAVIGVAIAITMLVVRIVSDFLHLRG